MPLGVPRTAGAPSFDAVVSERLDLALPLLGGLLGGDVRAAVVEGTVGLVEAEDVGDGLAGGELRTYRVEERRAGVAGLGGAPEHGDKLKVRRVAVVWRGLGFVVVVPCEVGAGMSFPYRVVLWMVFGLDGAEAAFGGRGRGESEECCRSRPASGYYSKQL